MTRRKSAPLLGVLLAAGVFLAACSPAETEPVREVVAPESPPAEVDPTTMQVPASFEEARLVEPAWQTEPQYADGVYLAGAEVDGVLEFEAVDVHGTALWTVQRPASCTGFVVTTAKDGRAIAVLGDLIPGPDGLLSTATALDLHTGDPIWGPITVPGPHQGPGLVYAAPPEAGMGQTGPKVALDPSTGRVAANETEGSTILGEYHGTVLLTDGGTLVAHDSATSTETWRTQVPDVSAPLVASVNPAPNETLALLTSSANSGILTDLLTGAILDASAHDAVYDPTTGTIVTLHDATLSAYDDTHTPLWSQPVSPETEIAALGSVLLYLREGDQIRVHNVITGEVAQAYDPEGTGPIALPSHITINGAAILVSQGRYLLATVP